MARRWRSTMSVLGMGALIGAVTMPVASAASAISFAPAVDYVTGGQGGSGPHQSSLAAADFTGDGKPDTVVADYSSSGRPRLMVNRGDGTFTSPGTQISAGFLTGTVAAGDLNADGRQDVVTTNASTVDVKLGNGDGTFVQGEQHSVFQGGQEDAVLHDFNRDGKLDVAVLQRGGVQMLLGNGNGTFAVGPRSSFGAFGQSGIAVANLDGDGVPDLVASEGVSQEVFALRGNGSGGFTVAWSASTPLVPGSLVPGDFDGDGDDDVAVYREFNEPGSSLGIYLNDGDGYTASQIYDGGLNPISATGADLNADGVKDLVASDTTTSRLVVHAGNGDGTFTAAGGFGGALFLQTSKAADFTGDGKLDLATAGIDGVGRTQLSILVNRS